MSLPTHARAAFAYNATVNAGRNTGHRPVLTYLALIAAIIAMFVAMAMVLSDGHFIYPIDDAYIHLALAENILDGHYGINPGLHSRHLHPPCRLASV